MRNFLLLTAIVACPAICSADLVFSTTSIGGGSVTNGVYTNTLTQDDGSGVTFNATLTATGNSGSLFPSDNTIVIGSAGLGVGDELVDLGESITFTLSIDSISGPPGATDVTADFTGFDVFQLTNFRPVDVVEVSAGGMVVQTETAQVDSDVAESFTLVDNYLTFSVSPGPLTPGQVSNFSLFSLGATFETAFTPAAVPEPSSLTLGVLLLPLLARRRRRQS